MTKNVKIGMGVLAVVALVAIIAAFRLNAKLASLQGQSTTQVTQNAEVQKMLAEVGQHMVLPTDEIPTAAVVSDLSKLKGQSFFERAELGDVVLVYANAKRVVLWRPSVQKIVEISAINYPDVNGQTPATTATKK